MVKAPLSTLCSAHYVRRIAGARCAKPGIIFMSGMMVGAGTAAVFLISRYHGSFTAGRGFDRAVKKAFDIHRQDVTSAATVAITFRWCSPTGNSQNGAN